MDSAPCHTQEEFIDSRPLIHHEGLRHFEKAFDSVYFCNGVPFVPWTSLQAKISPRQSRQLSYVVKTYFQGERLLVRGFTYRLTTGDVRSNRQGLITYLRLEYALGDTTMRECVDKIYQDWEKAPATNHLPEHEGLHMPGLLYGPLPIAGLYMLLCGSTESYHAGESVTKPSFLLKAGRSRDILDRFQNHSGSSGDFVKGGVVRFLYGLPVEIESLAMAEALMHAKLVELGFACPLVTQFPKRTYETYRFSSVALPLFHEVLFKLSGMFPRPQLPPLQVFLSQPSERDIPPLRSPAVGLRNLQ